MTMPVHCRHCGCQEVFRSRRRVFERLLVWLKPYRCAGCARRSFVRHSSVKPCALARTNQLGDSISGQGGLFLVVEGNRRVTSLLPIEDSWFRCGVIGHYPFDIRR